MLGWAEITRPIVGRTAQTLAKSGCSTNAVVGKSGNKSGSKWDEPAATECSHLLKQGRGLSQLCILSPDEKERKVYCICKEDFYLFSYLDVFTFLCARYYVSRSRWLVGPKKMGNAFPLMKKSPIFSAA